MAELKMEAHSQAMQVQSQAVAASTLPNFTDDLPSYFPLNSSLRIEPDFTKMKGLSQIDEKIAALNKVVDKFLAFLIRNTHLLHEENTQKFLTIQTEAYAELLKSKFKLETSQNALKMAQRELVASKHAEGNLTLENYHKFHKIKKQNFGDSIVTKLDKSLQSEQSLKAALKDDPTFQYLTNVTFVIQNPEDPLPDESTDEELAVSGGKISLKDPLSMDYFVEPVLSQKCKHVFEKKHIHQQLRGRNEIDCPITGCSALVSASDLKEDKLMALRVKVFQAGTQKREQMVRI